MRAERIDQRFERGLAVFMGMRQHRETAAFGGEPTGFVRVGKEADRRLRADQYDQLGTGQELDNLLGKIWQALHRHAPSTTLQPRREGVATPVELPGQEKLF